MKKGEKLLKTLLFLVILASSIAVFININLIQNFILNNHELSIFIYIFSWIILPIFFFPVPILAIAGGAMFGLFWGSLITIFAAMINLSIMYFIGKFLSFKSLNFKLKDSFMAILVLRFIPFVPYNLLNYSCGFLNISFKNYILASFFGITPATIILINLGKNALNFGSKEFYLSLFYLFILIVFSLGLSKWHSQLS